MLSQSSTPEIPSLFCLRDEFLHLYSSYCALSDLLDNTYGASTHIEPHTISNILIPINEKFARLSAVLDILVKADKDK